MPPWQQKRALAITLEGKTLRLTQDHLTAIHDGGEEDKEKGRPKGDPDKGGG